MNKDNAKEELLRDAIPNGLSEEDALLWMALLHTHEIHLQSGAMRDPNQASIRFQSWSNRPVAFTYEPSR